MSLPGYLLALLLFGLAGAAQAVEFDANIRAPRAVSGADLRAKFDAVATRVRGPDAVSALDAVRDRALVKERFDARYMLGALVDARVPLPEMEELGFKSMGDGRYSIDLQAHPEWKPLTESLLVLSEPAMVSGLENTLLARGFRPEDYLAMRNYLRAHDLGRARAESQLALVLSAGRMAKKLQKLKRLDDSFMASFFYQKQFARAETDRRWALGLLDALAPSAQRVLVSYLSEISSTAWLVPEDRPSAFAYERELLLSPDLEKKVRTAFEENRL